MKIIIIHYFAQIISYRQGIDAKESTISELQKYEFVCLSSK